MINAQRLHRHLDEVAAFGRTEKGGVNRQALSAEDRAARAWLVARAEARGFVTTTDEIANLFIRRAGGDPSLPAILIGSHLDSQPTGGRYDGALGVIAAFECLEALEDAGIATRHPVEAVAWTNEEGSRFEPGAMGSQIHSGAAVLPDWLDHRDRSGCTLAKALNDTRMALPHLGRHAVGLPAAYVELHIEQGPVLEQDGKTIGVVTGIQGTRWFEIVVEGTAAHAGTTPGRYRRDALRMTRQILEALDPIMAEDEDARVTCGRLTVAPDSINVIPDKVTFNLDLRHVDWRRLDGLEHRLRTEVARWAGRSSRVTRLVDLPPCRFPSPMVDLIEDAAKTLDLPYRRLLSGAFHDALYLARICPTGMIFVPSRGGLSHNEAEFTAPGHIEAGARLLLAVTRRLAEGEMGPAENRP
jgi:N-carbamoyl-L-amino-acid hydrolase